MKYHIIYKITNNINGKYYIGKHVTIDLNDGYMGSGKLITKALKKYGKENFVKEILSFHENENDLNLAEERAIDTTDKHSYNLQPGGKGGWQYVNNNNLGNTDDLKDQKSDAMKQYWTEERRRDKSESMCEYNRVYGTERYSHAMKKKHSDPAFKASFIRKMSEVNSREDKRLAAGEKIREKWKDPVFADKMDKRLRGSNSNAMKEKWKDPVFKQMMLDRRKKTHETDKNN
jgi:hypothetical protein